jgi:hypothetical protein
MTARISSVFIAMLCILFFLPGCLKDKCDRTHEFIRYDPVYKTPDGMRVDISVDSPQDLVSPGNIYYYNNYLLINERLQGVHVIDNTDPANPVNLAFIEIPGNRDIAIRNNILFADMFIDLVAIDISDVRNPELLCRVDNVFAQFYQFAGDMGYIVEYIPTQETVQIDCSDDRWKTWWWRGGDDVLWLSSGGAFASIDFASFDGQSSAESSNGSSTGIGGSMARFTLAKDHLYTLDQANMHVFDLSGSCPEQKNTIEMTWGIETLFPYGDYLFVGANNGMLIYNNEDPESPYFLSQFSHAQACDPVFVSDDIAYVTLRDGNVCRNFLNQLDVVDISTISNPKLIKSYPMDHPHGLSVADQTLFLCEGNSGLKVFDVEDNNTISQHLLNWVKGIHAFDVIVLPQSEVAMVIGEDGLYQYDVSDRNKLKELSVIPVVGN